MPYNFAADSFHTKKLCSRLSSKIDFYTRIRHFWILTPFGGAKRQRTMFILWLIRKRIVDFLLVIIEVFLLVVTPEMVRAKIDRKSPF